jgi:uncharacterized membrane protein
MAPSFAHRLRDEAPRWVRGGVISAQQAEAILARYPASAAWFSRPIGIFSLLGGALLVAATALLVAHNWHEIPRWIKLGGLVALMLAAYAAGLGLRARGYDKLAAGLFVLGGGLVLVGIALIGQIYNLSGRQSDAVLLWWVLILPADYLPDQRVIAGRARWFSSAVSRSLHVEYGIEHYYVPETAGTVPRGKLEAEIALTRNGRPFLTRLFVDGRPYP